MRVGLIINIYEMARRVEHTGTGSREPYLSTLRGS